MRLVTPLSCLALLAACATEPAPAPVNHPLAPTRAVDPAQSSDECRAAKPQPLAPRRAIALPADLLRQGRNGQVAVRYDIQGGQVRHAQVLTSEPAGLYDALVLRHAEETRFEAGVSVKGCLLTATFRF
jgi:outer membrane biosynthesis protein TonB